MKKITATVILALSSVFASSAFAAPLPQVLNGSAVGEEQIGVVSIRGVSGSTDDAINQLQVKAEKIGGSKINITGLGTPGDSSLWSGTAQVYR
ncbi:DUF1471 domain-containing protein [Cedecea sp. S5-13]|uniref:DUF1471 domain-containing protein n=1 Tax=Cedecea selenatireducens TaxID=3144416 RepID=UPI0035CCCF19